MYCPGTFPCPMRRVELDGNLYYQGDCVEGAREHLADGSVDLIVTDPPYGIGGDRLHQHYNRDEAHVVDGYVEVPEEEYDSQGCNVLAVAPRVAVALDGNPETRRRMEAAGVEVHAFRGREISLKGCGGPTCLTRPLERARAGA